MSLKRTGMDQTFFYRHFYFCRTICEIIKILSINSLNVLYEKDDCQTVFIAVYNVIV